MKLSGNACCSDFLLIGPTADTMRSFNKTLSVSSHCVYLETTADGEVGNRTDRGGDSGWKLGVLMLWTRTLSLLSQTSEPQSPSVKAFSCSTHSISCWFGTLLSQSPCSLGLHHSTSRCLLLLFTTRRSFPLGRKKKERKKKKKKKMITSPRESAGRCQPLMETLPNNRKPIIDVSLYTTNRTQQQVIIQLNRRL